MDGTLRGMRARLGGSGVLLNRHETKWKLQFLYADDAMLLA